MCQSRVKREVKILTTERGVDFKSVSGSLGLYLQHIVKNHPWLLRESGEHTLVIGTTYNQTLLTFTVYSHGTLNTHH